MRTTSLYVDILIIGIISSTWILALFVAFGLDYSKLLTLLESHALMAIILFTVLSYVLGLIFDYINASIFEYFKSKQEKERLKGISTIQILHHSPEIHGFLDNHYSRLRIMRAVILHSPMLGLISIALLLGSDRDSCAKFVVGFLIVAFTGLFIFISLHSYKLRNRVYINYLAEAKRCMKRKKR
jgi:hypothetical protein